MKEGKCFFLFVVVVCFLFFFFLKKKEKLVLAWKPLDAASSSMLSV